MTGQSRRTRLSPVVLLTLALAATAAALVVLVLPGLGSDRPGSLPWWALVPFFALAEVLVVHVQYRRDESLTISFGEIPLVLGLVFAGPVGFLAANVLGSTAGLLLHRGQRGAKLAFNVALLSLEAAVMQTVFHLLRGAAEPYELRGLLAVLVTVVVTDLLSAAAITAVIALDSGEFDPGVLLESVTTGLLVALTNSSMALLVVVALQHEPAALLLLLPVLTVLHLCYRSHCSLSTGHNRLERLYRFTRGVDRAVPVSQVLRDVLHSARDVLGADVSELVLPGGEGRPARHLRLAGDEVQELPVAPAGPDGTPPPAPWWAAALRGEPVLRPVQPGAGAPGRSGLAAPLPLEGGQRGALLVTGRPRHLPGFTAAELSLVAAVANHAAVAVQNARLVDRLRQEAAAQQHQALHDPLTGLANRRAFLEATEAALAQDVPGRCVVLLGLDGFQDINDALGFATGDLVLHEVGRRLCEQLAAAQCVARIGGDEYAVLFDGAHDDEAALACAATALAALASGFAVGEVTLDVRASVGVARSPEHGTDAPTLLQRAEVAMYLAKRAGSRVQVCDPLGDHGSARRLQLTTALRAALDEQHLEVHYQPKVDPASGRVLGAEALVRWRHPRLGPVSPDEFVPLAEYSGLIGPLTTFVLRTALRQCRVWRDRDADLSVAVNLSARSLTDLSLSAEVARLLAEAALPAEALTLEITESVVMSDPDCALQVLGDLRALGVHLSVDDFGTGLSSLAYLKRLPVHEVKIDKSFVTGLLHDAGDRAIVHAAVRLVHDLGLTVVAEGVEDAATARQLARWGCDSVQGYLYSPPLPADGFAAWLAGHATAPLSRQGSAVPGLVRQG